VTSGWFLFFSYHNDAQSNKHRTAGAGDRTLMTAFKLLNDYNYDNVYLVITVVVVVGYIPGDT